MLYSIKSYIVILYWYYIKAKENYKTLTVPCELFKMVSFGSLIVKKIVVFPTSCKLSEKLICCIAFGSTLNVC